jgi:AcrR family transcriptional regulator
MCPVSRRDRPAKPPLSREGIVATALAIMRADGLGRLTMRRLAHELDTGAASLYVYVSDTEELHAAMLDELLGDLSPPERGPWRERLYALVAAYHVVLFDHPGLASVALVTRLSGPRYLALVDAALGLLLEGGLTPAGAALTVDQLLLMTTASAVEHGTRAGLPDADRQHASLVAEIDAASAAQYPNIAALGRELVSGTPAARSRWAFDMLVNGALSTPPLDGPQVSFSQST